MGWAIVPPGYATQISEIETQFVPYFAWDNRGKSEMTCLASRVAKLRGVYHDNGSCDLHGPGLAEPMKTVFTEVLPDCRLINIIDDSLIADVVAARASDTRCYQTSASLL